MTTLRFPACLSVLSALSLGAIALAAPPKASGLLNWRGPDQTGVLPGAGFPEDMRHLELQMLEIVKEAGPSAAATDCGLALTLARNSNARLG